MRLYLLTWDIEEPGKPEWIVGELWARPTSLGPEPLSESNLTHHRYVTREELLGTAEGTQLLRAWEAGDDSVSERYEARQLVLMDALAAIERAIGFE